MESNRRSKQQILDPPKSVKRIRGQRVNEGSICELSTFYCKNYIKDKEVEWYGGYLIKNLRIPDKKFTDDTSENT